MKAVILAGGKGTRLTPYTEILPKPLMPIGDMPILEVLLRQLKMAGVTEVILTVGHLAHLLKAFFQDGDRLGIKIIYSYEENPLGTVSDSGLGFLAQAGVMARLAGPLWLDAFAGFRACTLRTDGEDPLEAKLGGLSVGLGLAYRF